MNNRPSTELSRHDLQWILRRTPIHILSFLKENGNRYFIAGGFPRACIANEEVQDIDIFAPNPIWAEAAAKTLSDEGKKPYRTDNAFTVRCEAHRHLPIQIIHRWTYANPLDCLASFDFTIAMAVFWWEGSKEEGKWMSACHPDFYADLAAKRLVYTSPNRNEDAGGSLLRVLKFYQRGYRIPLDSMGSVIARLLRGVRNDAQYFWSGGNSGGVATQDELDAYRTKILSGLLKEVDPNIDPSHIAHLPSIDEENIPEAQDPA